MPHHGVLIAVPPERTLPAPILHQAGVVILVHICRAVIIFVFFILHVLSRINVYTPSPSLNFMYSRAYLLKRSILSSSSASTSHFMGCCSSGLNRGFQSTILIRFPFTYASGSCGYLPNSASVIGHKLLACLTALQLQCRNLLFQDIPAGHRRNLPGTPCAEHHTGGSDTG